MGAVRRTVIRVLIAVPLGMIALVGAIELVPLMAPDAPDPDALNEMPSLSVQLVAGGVIGAVAGVWASLRIEGRRAVRARWAVRHGLPRPEDDFL
ncbi:MAG: hypothetical protein ACF8R9_10120 [Phycisphaerales bacterium JB054]